MATVPNESGSSGLHMYPGGPIDAAFRWFSAVVGERDLRSAWAITTDDLRLALAQSWLITTDRADLGADARARAIADGDPGALWDEFEQWRLTRWLTLTWTDVVEDGFSTYSEPEFAAPEICFVRFVPGQISAQVDSDSEPMWMITFTLRYDAEGWRVAGIGRRLPVPGWPPTEVEVPSDRLAPPS